MKAMPVSLPTSIALFVDKITVKRMADDSVKMQDKIAHAFHAILTDFDSCRSGQNKSKKNAAPKIVATNTPTKMLYEKDPTISWLLTVTSEPSVLEYFWTYLRSEMYSGSCC